MRIRSNVRPRSRRRLAGYGDQAGHGRPVAFRRCISSRIIKEMSRAYSRALWRRYRENGRPRENGVYRRI